MKVFKKTLAAVLVLFALLMNLTAAYAQPGGGGDPLPCDPDDPSGCPIDSWIFLLAALFLLYAAYRLHQKKQSPPA